MFPVWRATSDYEDARIAYDANRLSYESLKDTESSKLCGLSSSHLFFKKTPPNRGKGGIVFFLDMDAYFSVIELHVDTALGWFDCIFFLVGPSSINLF